MTSPIDIIREALTDRYVFDREGALAALTEVEHQLSRQRKALEQIRLNARAWHGPELDNGHARALAVIGTWCDEALGESHTAARAALDRHTREGS